MNVSLIVAGSLAILGAGIHGLGGELLLVRKLSPAMFPPNRLGGPSATLRMIHVTWHMTTVAFLTVGCALLVAGLALHGDTRRAVGILAAGGSTGFAALAVGMAADAPGFPRALVRHPAPAMLTATAVLAWLGAL
ncbi:MAG TPA: hypothetical protein VE127_11640 [Solirubrobacteraceae bacterium]|nr:hypothetical protein [Solirubrobacteraceae bacterium]